MGRDPIYFWGAISFMSALYCKICKAAVRALNDNKSGKIYHVCDVCGFIFLDQRFILSPADEKRRYEFHQNTFDNPGYVAMFERFIADVIMPHCGTAATALDFGCGTTPVLATLLNKHIADVDHYDPYFYPDQAFKKKKYDLITATEVIEHLQDPLATLKMLVALLNPGGALALMTKFHPCDDAKFLKWWYRVDDTHIAFYAKHTIEYLAQSIGLEETFVGDGVCYLKRRT
jgi:predicted TPR repeat methyltransferase